MNPLVCTFNPISATSMKVRVRPQLAQVVSSPSENHTMVVPTAQGVGRQAEEVRQDLRLGGGGLGDLVFSVCLGNLRLELLFGDNFGGFSAAR